jgi:hypothetical protein
MWGFVKKELLQSILTTRNQYWKSMLKPYYWKPQPRTVIKILLLKNDTKNL